MAVYFRLGFAMSGSVLPVQFDEGVSAFALGFDEGIGTGELPSYEGGYEVTPKVEAQTLSTANRSMEKDLTVLAIPYYEVDNNQQGQTIIIGGN